MTSIFFDIVVLERSGYMLIKSSAINRLLRENPRLKDRRYGLPYIGARLDGEKFNPTVQEIAEAIDFYGYKMRDSNIVSKPDINLGGGNSMKFEPFPLSIKAMIDSFTNTEMYKYPYTEGDDGIRNTLLEYIKQEGFINTEPYDYEDIDDSGLSIHNITFLPSTSIAFNLIVNIISKPGDVVIVTGPNYGLFSIRAERSGAEVEIIPLSADDNWLISPKKLADKIDDINETLQKAYHRRRGYVPRVVAFVNANPNNPTGKVMGKKEEQLLEAIGNVCLERGVFIIDDMVYRDITFDKDNIAKPIATIPGMFRNTITLFGLSKSHGMASLRAGFVIADEIVIREIVNRAFQEMDSSPDIVGRALSGAFNATPLRNKIHDEYFMKVRNEYIFRYNILKAFIEGIDSIKDDKLKNKVYKTIKLNIKSEKKINKLLKGMPYTKFPKNLEPEAGFFAILDFTELRGKSYKGGIILTEEDLLKFFYRAARIRFLVGQSISWPTRKELIGRITFALEPDELIRILVIMNDILITVKEAEPFIIRKNLLKDQGEMAHIKIDGWKEAYKEIVDSEYLESMDYDNQKERYIESFEDYKDTVLVAVNPDTEELLGYSCFDLNPKDKRYDSELVSLYVKPAKKSLGIGTALFKETMNELKKYNKKKMGLWCFKDNIKSINFYTNLGSSIIGEKNAEIGNRKYREVGFIFELDMQNDSV